MPGVPNKIKGNSAAWNPPNPPSGTHHECCNGCSGGFVITPGVCGSSMGSASGGTAVPSTLSVRVRA
jgi:hypothetical protein